MFTEWPMPTRRLHILRGETNTVLFVSLIASGSQRTALNHYWDEVFSVSDIDPILKMTSVRSSLHNRGERHATLD